MAALPALITVKRAAPGGGFGAGPGSVVAVALGQRQPSLVTAPLSPARDQGHVSV